MVAPIEDQILAHLVEQEEKRCEALEEEFRRDPKRKHKKVPRRKIVKPWTRGAHPTLCQETDLLLMVKDYDYDLANEGFQSYCSSRGVLHVAGTPGSERWEIFRVHSKRKADYMDNPYFQYAGGISGKGMKYTARQMDTGWRIVRIGRAKLQDCWELFLSKTD